MQNIYGKIFNKLLKFTGPVPDRIRTALLFLCCGSLVWVYFFYPGTLGNRKVEIFGSAVLAAIAILSINRKMEPIEWNRWIYRSMVLFGIGILVIGAIHPLGEGFLIYALDLIVVFPALYYIWINRGDFDTLYKILSTAVIAAGIISFIYCIMLSVTGELAVEGGRVAGYKGNVNLLGMMGVALVMSGAYLLMEYYQNMRITALSSAGLGIGISYVIVSVSRTSMLAVLVCIAVFAIFRIREYKAGHLQQKFKWTVIVLSLCIAASVIAVGVSLETINNKASNAMETITENDEMNDAAPESGDLANRFNPKGISVDRFSSGRLTILKTYVQNTTLLGRPHAYMEEKLKDAPDTRAHNNIIEYCYRCGIIVGSIYVFFYAALVISGLKLLFFGDTANRYNMFVVMNVGVYSVFALLEITFLPFIRVIPCIFFLSIAPLMTRDHS